MTCPYCGTCAYCREHDKCRSFGPCPGCKKAEGVPLARPKRAKGGVNAAAWFYTRRSFYR
jgi:hypothetical protein